MKEQESPGQVVGDNQAATKPPQGAKPVRRPRTLFGRLCLILGSLLVGLVLCELAVRLVAALTHHVPLVVSDAHAGWALQPDLRDQIRAGDGGQYVISTDKEGHRLTRGANEPPADGPAVILVGDSFVQGQSVNDSQTFAWILAHETNRNVVNLGVLGYGTTQELAGLDAYLEAHPTLAVGDIVVLVFDNDFVDVQMDSHPALGRSKPRYGVAGGRLEKTAYQRSFSDHLMDFSYLYWLVNSKRALFFKDPEPDAAGGAEVVIACLAAMRDVAAVRGARLHVLAHQHLRKPGRLSKSDWADFLHRAGATDVTPPLQSMEGADPVSYDGGHWSAAGHRQIATIVKEKLEQVK